MKKTSDIRTAQRASGIKAWLEAESKISALLMAEDGPVTRKEVILTAVIIILVAVGLTIDNSLFLTLLCFALAGVLIGHLREESETNSKEKNYGK